MPLEEGIYSWLSASSTVSALVSDRIYPATRPQGEALPAITFDRTNSDHPHHLTAAAEIAMAIEGLAKHFGGLKALDGVDMAVRRGTVHALIGPNGSGKTTFINVVTGLYRPTAGRIAIAVAQVTPPLPLACRDHDPSGDCIEISSGVIVSFHCRQYFPPAWYIACEQ